MVVGLMMAGLTLAFGLADSPQASWGEKNDTEPWWSLSRYLLSEA